MTHLKGKTSAQKKYVVRHLKHATKKVVWAAYRAVEQAEGHHTKKKTTKKHHHVSHWLHGGN